MTTAAPIAPPAIAPTFTDVVVVVAVGVVVMDILLVDAAPTIAEGGVVLLPGPSVCVVIVVIVAAAFNVAAGIRNSLCDISKAYSHDIGLTWKTLL
jgi:hypothetical protein